jgi:hypothetical protein
LVAGIARAAPARLAGATGVAISHPIYDHT